MPGHSGPAFGRPETSFVPGMTFWSQVFGPKADLFTCTLAVLVVGPAGHREDQKEKVIIRFFVISGASRDAGRLFPCA